MFSLYSASTSMNCFTSSTVKKCRATSSIAPRHAKRGRSVIVPGGTLHAAAGALAVRQLHLDRGGEQLPQRLRAAEHAGGRRARDAHRVRADRELIAFVAERPLAAKPEHDRTARRRCVARRDGNRARRRYAQQRGEHLPGARELAFPAGTTMLVVAVTLNGEPLPAVTVTGSGTSRWSLSDASGVSAGGRVSAVAAGAGAGVAAGAGVVATGVGRQAATAQLSAMAAWTRAGVWTRLIISNRRSAAAVFGGTVKVSPGPERGKASPNASAARYRRGSSSFSSAANSRSSRRGARTVRRRTGRGAALPCALPAPLVPRDQSSRTVITSSASAARRAPPRTLRPPPWSSRGRADETEFGADREHPEVPHVGIFRLEPNAAEQRPVGRVSIVSSTAPGRELRSARSMSASVRCHPPCRLPSSTPRGTNHLERRSSPSVAMASRSDSRATETCMSDSLPSDVECATEPAPIAG